MACNPQAPKLTNLTSQLIQYHYLDEFYFYFAKPINEILSGSRSAEYIGYREMRIEGKRPKLDISFFNHKDFTNLVKKEGTSQKHQYFPNMSVLCNWKVLVKGEFKKRQVYDRTMTYPEHHEPNTQGNQLFPLRDGQILPSFGGANNNNFVDDDSFLTKSYDIYNPSFSSTQPGEISSFMPQLTDRFDKDKPIHTDKSSIFLERNYDSKPKIQIPLLKLKAKKGFIDQKSASIEEKKKKKLKSLVDVAGKSKSRAYGNSENQSTQFSLNCTKKAQGWRKQTADENKGKRLEEVYSSRSQIKLQMSPVVKKKKVEIPSKSKETFSRNKKRKLDTDPRNLQLRSSLMNLKKTKLMKSLEKLEEVSHRKSQRKPLPSKPSFQNKLLFDRGSSRQLRTSGESKSRLLTTTTNVRDLFSPSGIVGAGAFPQTTGNFKKTMPNKNAVKLFLPENHHQTLNQKKQVIISPKLQQDLARLMKSKSRDSFQHSLRSHRDKKLTQETFVANGKCESKVLIGNKSREPKKSIKEGSKQGKDTGAKLLNLKRSPVDFKDIILKEISAMKEKSKKARKLKDKHGSASKLEYSPNRGIDLELFRTNTARLV
jgi:hypothetical protein